MLGVSDKQREHSRSQWQQFVGSNGEPYEVIGKDAGVDFKPSSTQSKVKYDIVAAAQRQANFNYQISLPDYGDEKYISGAVERFVNTLSLIVQHNFYSGTGSSWRSYRCTPPSF